MHMNSFELIPISFDKIQSQDLIIDSQKMRYSQN